MVINTKKIQQLAQKHLAEKDETKWNLKKDGNQFFFVCFALNFLQYVKKLWSCPGQEPKMSWSSP